MPAQSARAIDQDRVSKAALPLATRATANYQASAVSPAATLQHQIEVAVLQGFFNKSSRGWRRSHRPVVIMVGMTISIWVVVFALIWTWVY